MRRALLSLTRCPRCLDAPLTPAGDVQQIADGELVCRNGHRFPVRRGVLDTLEPSAAVNAQRELAARERLGRLSVDEADAYRRHISQIGFATYNDLIRENARAALKELPVTGGWSLDLGGGSGWLAATLARRGFQAVSVDAEDPIERQKQIDEGAQARTYELVTDVMLKSEMEDVDYVVSDFDRLPFVDSAFDLVTTSATLHHAEDPVRTLREAARVLKPDGYVLSVNEQARGLFRDESWVMQGHGEDAGERIYWAREYLGFFRRAGFRPRLVFPGWIDRKLRDRDWTGVVYYPRLRKLAGALWRVPGVRTLVRGPLFRPALYLFGLTVIVVARKERL